MKTRMGIFTVVLAEALTACGSDSKDEPPSSPPSEETLCKLKFAESTIKDATLLLGSPQSRTSSTLVYVWGNALPGLNFDPTLAYATVTNISWPKCWPTA